MEDKAMQNFEFYAPTRMILERYSQAGGKTGKGVRF